MILRLIARLKAAAGAILVSAALLTAHGAGAQDLATVQRLNDTLTAALSKGDFDTVASMYTEGAYLLPPNAPMVRGRRDIQTFWTQASGSIRDVKLTALDVKPLGPGALREVGAFSLVMQGTQQRVVGKYVVVWEIVGTEWKLATDIWNADK